MPKPICFMIMPYGTKSTGVDPSGSAPGEIDFNALWDRAYAPVIEALGYEPVRADQDTGSMIITQMIERLYFADLVLADMTIPNGNVYYEVGLRHAAKEVGCVLLAADWSKALFDVAQMRTLRYPLPEGAIVEATAQAVQAAIKGPIESLGRGVSPMFQSIPGYPTAVNPAAATSMKDVMAELAAFQGQIRAVRALPVSNAWRRPKSSSRNTGGRRSPERPRSDFFSCSRIAPIPPPTGAGSPISSPGFRRLSPTRRRFARRTPLPCPTAGNPIDAIAKLEELIARSGPTPERLGLLGGRYKRLFVKAANSAERQVYLNKAIDAYERGMELDLNQYYCSSNLPRLYRQRKRKGDDERARSVSALVVAACERAKKARRRGRVAAADAARRGVRRGR